MDIADLKTLVREQLSLLKADIDIEAAALVNIRRHASDPTLQVALQKGSDTLKRWDRRLSLAFQQLGCVGREDQTPMCAHYELTTSRIAQATEACARDLAILASCQVSLHYWIASFRTMCLYAAYLGSDSVARDMSQSAKEAALAASEIALIAKALLAQVIV